MKAVKWFATAVSILVCFHAHSVAQETTNLQGTWEFTVSDMCEGWDGTKQPAAFKLLVYLYASPFTDPTVPNLVARFPGEPDMNGFSEGRLIAFYRNWNPTVNWGGDVLIARVIGNGRELLGDGLGFDSRTQRGGTCSYHISGRKMSDDVPAR